MTSLAFIFGVLPLAISTGAGAKSRVEIGTAVIGGMLTATAIAIFLVPLFFVLVRKLFGGAWFKRKHHDEAAGMKRALILLALLGGCSMEPHYVRPTPAIPANLPASDEVTALLDRRAIFRDPRLLALIERAITSNQNLAATLANVQVARGQYRVQRADLFPAVDLSGGYSIRRGTGSTTTTGTGTGTTVTTGGGTRSSYSVDAGVSAFELDLFGRVRSLTHAALDEYLATNAGARAVRVTLVGDVAEAWVHLCVRPHLAQHRR